jgi:RNA polymerase sigma-70 factor (ECF subfamily)
MTFRARPGHYVQPMTSPARTEDEFRRLVEPHRAELHAHCYRMLGSVHDAEDALQDALLRAWRGIERFEGRSSLRSWLYRIATNTSLDLIARRPKRILPADHGPPSEGPDDRPPVVEAIWLEAYPDERYGVEEGYAAPEARYERRESVELAFIAAVQHLPPTQRAVLLLRDVLGFSARETAATLDTTVDAANSALARARRALDGRLPARTQQATLRALRDDGVRAIVERYMDALDRGDVDALVAMLAEDAEWAMPPEPGWYRGIPAITRFLETGPMRLRWRHLPTHANGQPAVGCYLWSDEREEHVGWVIDVLTLDGPRIGAVTSFIGHENFARFGLPAALP